eukprot:TRINITY_DN20196_c0_g1_i1.p2 TRINITY_DN20196_c0_g1~~TRINITY_DN20196_c0_g1_i1.p2  ORF type:complete len:120 (-),score=21.02 TRINITY_DN20196_c0_g1_i1:193-552(-)
MEPEYVDETLPVKDREPDSVLVKLPVAEPDPVQLVVRVFVEVWLTEGDCEVDRLGVLVVEHEGELVTVRLSECELDTLHEAVPDVDSEPEVDGDVEVLTLSDTLRVGEGVEDLECETAE